MDKVSVILVDDHRMFREGLNLLLSNFLFVAEVTEASGGEEFLAALNKRHPDIVFMDINLPGMDGIAATRKALETYPDLNIVGLSMYGDEDYLTRMIDAGAKGFILKNSGISEIENAILQIRAGANYFSPEILSVLIKSINRKKQPKRNTELTEREEEVLFRICKGLSNQEIADTLNISKRTVDKHRENILLKTGSGNTAGLVMYAIKNGIVDVE
ncbi:MAG: response regulator transcription factor [Bacteroidales bacterium]|nr:response regulator transcription factor [Bacteroidales bacterium]